MTKKEWTIIGVLGTVVVVVFACMGILILGMPAQQSRQANPVAISNLPSETPEQLPTRLSATQVKPTTPPQPTRTAVPTETPRPTATLTPKPLTPSEKLTQLAKDGLGKDSFSSMFMELVSTSITDATATVAYKPSSTAFNQESYVAPFMEHLQNIVPQAFDQFPNINVLEVNQRVGLVDVYGKKSEDVGIRIVISRATNAKIDWKSFYPKNLPKVLTGKGDVFDVHPALSEGWATYQKKY